MKVLILKNRIIKSLKSQIKEIVGYYSAIEPLEITEKYVSLKPEYEIQKYYTETGTIDMNIISEKWLKSKVPTGYDIVIFLSKEWKCDWLGGLNFITSNKPKLIIVRYVVGEPYTFVEGNQSITLQGDKLTWTIKHELSHALCNLKILPDLTHKYYLLGKPKECFNTMKTAILTRQPSDKKQTLGEMKCVNGNNYLTIKTLELPWLNNAKNISCIPTGIYRVKWTRSLKFPLGTYEVQDVPGRSGVRLHIANFFTQIEGCISLGMRHAFVNKDNELDTAESKIAFDTLNSFYGKKDFTLVIK